jgi:hypothetical protein
MARSVESIDDESTVAILLPACKKDFVVNANYKR